MAKDLVEQATVSRPRRNRQVQGEGDARERLLAAGEKLFAKRSFDTVSTDEICRAAQVAHGLLFHYFGSKRAFMLAVTRHAADRVEAVHLSLPPQKTSELAVRAFLKAHMDLVQARRESFIANSRGSAGVDAELRGIWEDGRRRALHLFCGYLGIADPPPKLFVLLRAWVGFFDELMLAWVQRQDMSQDEVVDTCVLCLRELLANYQLLDPGARLQMSHPLSKPKKG